MTPTINKAITKVTSSCIPYTSSGRPAKTTELSMKHVNKECNNEVQANILTVKAEQSKHKGLNIVDAVTGYG